MFKVGIFLHFFCGVGAIFGGLAGILNPQGIWGLNSEMLVNGPFRSFFIPGLFLFVVLGLGNLIAGLLILRRPEFAAVTFMFMGLIQIFFILIQVFVLWDFVFLHGLFLFIGIVQLGCGLRQLSRKGIV